MGKGAGKRKASAGSQRPLDKQKAGEEKPLTTQRAGNCQEVGEEGEEVGWPAGQSCF